VTTPHEKSALSLDDKLAAIDALLTKLGLRRELAAPLSEGDVLAVEAKYGIRLPEDYRAFVTRLGDGGPGPVYGVLRLSDSVGWNSSEEGTLLSAPCGLVPDEDYWATFAADSSESGIMPFIHTGCGDFYWIVVTGKARGRILYHGGTVCFADDAGFVDFYLRWLGEMEEAGTHVVGQTRDGALFYGDGFNLLWKRTEEDLLGIAAARPPEQRLIQVFQGLRRIEVSSRSLPFVRASARDDRPAIRAAAAPVLAKLQESAELFELLRDPNDRVRYAAALASRNLAEAATTGELITALQRESVSNTYYAIADELLRRKALTADLVLETGLAHGAVQGIVRNAVYFLDKVPGPVDRDEKAALTSTLKRMLGR
jgi:hypothetical protein